jgi:hypothetical protein
MFSSSFGGVMSSNIPVEAADRLSRRRAIVIVLAVVAFLVGQLVARPFFVSDNSDHLVRLFTWAVNAGLLLVVLATGGCLLRRKSVRSLMNDEVTAGHQRSSVISGFWVAMATAVLLCVIPGSDRVNAREAMYVVVTASVAAALLVFSYLEIRALRDV